MPKKKINVQHAALPYRVMDGQLLFMLITSRETRRWIIPKGWPMKGMQPHQVAAQEAYEEAGLRGVAQAEALANFKYTKRLALGKRCRVTMDVYPLEVTEVLDEWPEKGQRERDWVTADQAAGRVAETGLIEMFRSIATAIAEGRSFLPAAG